MLALFLACGGEIPVQAPAVEPLALHVGSPGYGAFLGDDAALVTGWVRPAGALLVVNDVEVTPDAHGLFSLELPLDGEVLVVDVQASHEGQEARERLPVFWGHDPLETWPGGLGLRLTDDGLDALGGVVAAMIDELGWEEQLSAGLPGYESDWLDLTPEGVSHSETLVELTPTDDGVATAVALVELELIYVLDLLGYEVELGIGFEEVGLSLVALPAVDDDGMVWISLSGAGVVLGEPILTLGDLDTSWLEAIGGVINGLLEPIGEALLEAVLSSAGELELGGPFAFETDLMGTALSARLQELESDTLGVRAGLGLGLGEEAPEELDLPAPNGIEGAQAAVALHEGMFQLLLQSELLAMLESELQLAGDFGELIGGAIRALPGGDEVPDDAEGWCLELDPGTARVARLQEGTAPLAKLYLPDLRVTASTMKNGACFDWLEASLLLEIGLGVDGTALDMQLGVIDGAVLDYGAEGDWDEDAVVEGLGGFVETAVSLLGGSLGFDLADLLGGADLGIEGLEGLNVSVLASERLTEDEAWVEGLYDISLSLVE